ncbi:MAG: hypothetical protein IKU29_05205 [Parabacteroides sp.]|nr:hypothetical protein [Parabacteroides sp.]
MLISQTLINGQDFDIRPWLENFREFYFKYIKQEAQKLVSEKLSDRYYEISDSLNALKEKLDHIENNIDWDAHIIK